MSDVVDISPPHEPISLAREMVDEAPGTKAAVAILVREDGSIWYRSCGHECAYVMWALQSMIHELMENE